MPLQGWQGNPLDEPRRRRQHAPLFRWDARMARRLLAEQSGQRDGEAGFAGAGWLGAFFKTEKHCQAKILAPSGVRNLLIHDRNPLSRKSHFDIIHAMNQKIRTIPRVFFDDHAERDLPTPAVLRETKRTVTISLDDPNTPELIDDAQHYAHPDGPDLCNLAASAKALLRAIA